MKIFLSYILIGIILLLEGCVPHVVIIIFNRTPSSITIQANNQEVTILKDSAGEIYPHSLTPNLPMVVSSPDQTQRKVNKRYTIIPFPRSYVRPLIGGIKGYEVLFQVEPNGFIYVLPPGSDLPCLELKPQPKGYPLKPSS